MAVQGDKPEFDGQTAQHSLGLAFAGSTLLANNCHGIASALTQQFRSGAQPFLPSASGVADIYAAVGEHVTRDFNSRRARPEDWTFFQTAIFGYCPVLKALCVYVIAPEVSGTGFSITVAEHRMNPRQVITLGSGSKLFEEFRVEEAKRGRGGAQALFKRVVASGKLKDVGGYTQYAEADQYGARLVPTIIQSPSDPEKKTLSVLGFDVWSLGRIDGLDFGSRAFGAGEEAATARLALREKGIDPDNPVSREVQNLASVEAGLATAFALGQQLMLDGQFSIARWDPGSGRRYFVAACQNCRHYSPLCLDPSNGSWEPFVGNGQLKSTCHWCGEPIAAGRGCVKSQVWTGEGSNHSVPLTGLPGGGSL